MLEANLLQLYLRPLEEAQIDYMVTGSVATIIYGEPRLTHDIDLVLHVRPQQVSALLTHFPIEQFYAPPEEVVQVELRRGVRAHFNIIHHESGFKADCYLVGNDPLHAWAMQHRRCIVLGDEMSIWVAPPEYVIVRKLEYFREGESAKHIDDIKRMLPLVGELDRAWIAQSVKSLGLLELWQSLESNS